jgi:hypothetical protein
MPYEYPSVTALPSNLQLPYRHSDQAIDRLPEGLPMLDLDVSRACEQFSSKAITAAESSARGGGGGSVGGGINVAKLLQAPILADTTFSPSWIRTPPAALTVEGVLGAEAYPAPHTIKAPAPVFFFPSMDLCMSSSLALPALVSATLVEQQAAGGGDPRFASSSSASLDAGATAGGAVAPSSLSLMSTVIMSGLEGVKLEGASVSSTTMGQQSAASTAAISKTEALEAAFLAARTDNVAELDILLLSGQFDIDDRDDHGNTLFISACQSGVARVARLLMRRRANLNKKNEKGNTALHYCFAYGYKDLAQLLISNGADEMAKNNDGLTPYEGIDAEALENL